MKAQDCWTLFILKLASCLALCLALCLGCGNPAQQKAYNLQGEWTLQSLTVDGRELSGIKQAAITLVCNGTRLHGSGACNPYEARYESPQTGELKVTQQSWAEMECLDETQGLIDDAYVQALWKARKVQLNADELVLSDSTGNHRLVFIPMTGSASVGLGKTSGSFLVLKQSLEADDRRVSAVSHRSTGPLSPFVSSTAKRLAQAVATNFNPESRLPMAEFLLWNLRRSR